MPRLVHRERCNAAQIKRLVSNSCGYCVAQSMQQTTWPLPGKAHFFRCSRHKGAPHLTHTASSLCFAPQTLQVTHKPGFKGEYCGRGRASMLVSLFTSKRDGDFRFGGVMWVLTKRNNWGRRLTHPCRFFILFVLMLFPLPFLITGLTQFHVEPMEKEKRDTTEVQ